MIRDLHLFWGNIGILVVAFVFNIATNRFNLGLYHQPVAHSQWIWNVLGPWSSALAQSFWAAAHAPARPHRHRHVDPAITVLGLLVGAAVSHNFGLASSGDVYEEGTSIVVGGGATPGGCIAVIVALALMILDRVFLLEKPKAKVSQ